ncbi:MAG TPA: energy transducer TonB [Candidatus Eisenbacteria bacterium]|nr:energy transducer TonB [Candidatus Eisenbacteria bacterium]
MLRLSATPSGRISPLDTSSFLGFEVLESMELPGEGAKRVAHALGQAESYGCADELGEADAALPDVQIGYEFSSASERVRLVLFAPDQGVEMELANGLGARVVLSAKGDHAWWEAMRPLLRPGLQRSDFYTFMSPPDGAFPGLDPLDRGPDTNLELPLVPVTRVPPEYSATGVLRVRALVGPDGRVHRAEVSNGFAMFYDAARATDAARAAVLQWQFRPPLKDGKVVWAWTSVTVDFHGPARDLPWEIDAPTWEAE